MKFRDYFSLRHILFGVFIIILMIIFAVVQSDNMITVSMNTDAVNVSSTRYSMRIQYSLIESAELTELAEAGERVADCWDDDLIRVGVWKNDTWGEYHINVDLDASNCIVLHLNDGRTFIFNGRSNEYTEELFAELQGHLAS